MLALPPGHAKLGKQGYLQSIAKHLHKLTEKINYIHVTSLEFGPQTILHSKESSILFHFKS